MHYAHDPSRKRSEPPGHRWNEGTKPFASVFWLTSIPREMTAGVHILMIIVSEVKHYALSCHLFSFSLVVTAFHVCFAHRLWREYESESVTQRGQARLQHYGLLA